MYLLEVLIERKVNILNRPFTYAYTGAKDINVGYRVFVNFNNQKIVGYVIKINKTNKTSQDLEKELGFEVKEIIDVIDQERLLNDELMHLAQEIASYYLVPYISVLQAMLPKSLKPASSTFSAPKIAYNTFVRVGIDSEENLTPKQIEVLRLVKENGQILRKEIGSPSIAKKLIDSGHLITFQVEKYRYRFEEVEVEETKILNFEQQKAVEEILDAKQTVSLLQGVTGSGKTEVYLALSEKFIKEGKNVLMLVPEIGLTPMIVSYFRKRFLEEVAILHSDLTEAEKYDEYRRIAQNKCRIVIGARSAIFAPLENIGLLIIDEEHVEAYKQDSLPFYHAREVAIMRAKYFKARVVLGSATPSLESKARALKGVYHLATISKRYNEQILPNVSIINMANPASLVKKSALFSEILLNKITDRLRKKEQIILLINRRGYSSYLSCRQCGHLFKCPDCDLTLTYHKVDEMLKCHYCGHVEFMPIICPSCGGTYFAKSGFGTQRIVDELARLFPEARVLRLDSDVSRVRQSITKTVEKFRTQKADILVGTQMVAKGHDFPLVTLVGIVSADVGLSIPSFRSSERTFELITQAVGRSGRAHLQGEAIIQTYNPHHYVIKLGAKQDYETFFKKEMFVRRAQQTPPYTYLISLEVSSKNESLLIKTIHKIAEDLRYQNLKDVHVVGPVSPFISFQHKTHYRHLYIKFKDETEIKKYLLTLLKTLQTKTQINLVVNVDPNDNF
ncbi:MAG: primosomal protein N' [Bacilli bacterium]|jgi:primosomal protein N' (replication factor Y)|nr:primosomal protein N' [Erysipelotrichia bacterium]